MCTEWIEVTLTISPIYFKGCSRLVRDLCERESKKTNKTKQNKKAIVNSNAADAVIIQLLFPCVGQVFPTLQQCIMPGESPCLSVLMSPVCSLWHHQGRFKDNKLLYNCTKVFTQGPCIATHSVVFKSFQPHHFAYLLSGREFDEKIALKIAADWHSFILNGHIWKCSALLIQKTPV